MRDALLTNMGNGSANKGSGGQMYDNGARVMTPGGCGTVVYSRMAPPTFSEVAAYSVALDHKVEASKVPPFPTYTGTVFAASEVKVLRCDPRYRDILAWIVRSDRSARKAYAHLVRCGASNIRPDYMLVRNATGTYDRLPDFGAWNAYIPRFGGMSACMLRGKDGVWFLNS